MIPQHPLDELLNAARQKQWTVVDRIIQAGTPINQIHPIAGRPIVSVLASQARSFMIVKELLNRGADRGHALEGAAMGGQSGLMRYLIEQGGDINRALYGASVMNREKLVTELIEKGADPYWGVKGAARGNHRELHQRLGLNVFLTLLPSIQRVGAVCAEQAGVTDDDWYTAMEGNLEAWNKLSGLTGNLIQSFAGVTPTIHKELFSVYEIALGGHTELVLQLTSSPLGGIDDAVRGAAVGRRLELVKTLLMKGASPEEAIWGLAFRGVGEPSIERILAKYKSIPQEILLNKAVQGAASGGHPQLVHWLLNRGANLNLAIEAATIHGHTTLVDSLTALREEMDDAILESVLDTIDSDSVCAPKY